MQINKTAIVNYSSEKVVAVKGQTCAQENSTRCTRIDISTLCR